MCRKQTWRRCKAERLKTMQSGTFGTIRTVGLGRDICFAACQALEDEVHRGHFRPSGAHPCFTTFVASQIGGLRLLRW
jgi:hypothetical protein